MPESTLPTASASMGLHEAALRLGVHYMTAYRYVRTGRLDAFKVGAEWRVTHEALRRMRAGEQPEDGPPQLGHGAATGHLAARQHRRVLSRQRLERRLVAGDEQGCWSVIETTLASGASPTEVHVELVAPALQSIAERSDEGELTVCDERRAAVLALRLVARLATRFARPGRRRGIVVVGAVRGDPHEANVAMLADQLRGAGFEVIEFGANTPPEAFAETVSSDPLAIVLEVTGHGHNGGVEDALRAIRARGHATVLVGGSGVASAREAFGLGADAWTGESGHDAVAVVEVLANGRAAVAAH